MREQKMELFNKILPSIIATFGIFFSLIGANTCCCCIFHQPDKPDLKKLRRF